MEQAGATVTWDAAAKVAKIEKRGTVVQIPIGANYIIVDGKQVATDTAAVIKNGRTYLPIRAVLEAVDFTVEWDNDTRTVLAANYYDYVANQEMVVEGERQNISSAEDLLNYLADRYRLENDKDIAVKLAERDYLDKLNETPEEIISYFEWYTKDQLEHDGITLDDSAFTIEINDDYTESTIGGKLVLEGNGNTLTINVPQFTLSISADSEDQRIRTYDGVTINFSPWSIEEFKGEDLAKQGLIAPLKEKN